ncbi:MAG: hypothetical protein JSS87_00595 [Acidobacteria bacterium]|nr:hypothetical protein [Acidobacteriota bacterium]
MRFIWACTLLATTILCAQTSSPSLESNLYGNVSVVPHSRIRLLLPGGTFHGEEVKDVPKSGWLAFTFVHGVASLQPTTLHITHTHDEISDDDNPQAKTGIIISNSGPRAYFLLHGIKPRAQVLTFQIDKDGIPLSQRFSIQSKDLDAELEILAPVTGQDGFKTVGAGSRIVFREHGIEQELAHFGDEFNDGHVSILWLGDLDGDGKLDLLLDISGHYNVMNPVLFLSKGAPQLVQAVASFPTTGC